MRKIILADNQAIFRAGTANVLGMEDDLRIIAQCPDCPRLYLALGNFRDAIAIFASSMQPDINQLSAAARLAATRLILVEENGVVSPRAVLAQVHSLIYRDVSKAALLETVRRTIRGERWIHPAEVKKSAEPEDLVGASVRDRLTPKEMKIVSLISQGYKNKEIGLRLGTSEQVIKNYLRSIYDKSGVSDRLKLALFTINHRTLAAAANSANSDV